MKLDEWEEKHSACRVERPTDRTAHVPDTLLITDYDRARLWRLEDYRVTAVQGGTIYLGKREK